MSAYDAVFVGTYSGTEDAELHNEPEKVIDEVKA